MPARSTTGSSNRSTAAELATLVDTSALYDLLDADGSHHAQAAAAFRQLLERGERLLTHSYVLVETTALLQRRIGVEAVRALESTLLPVLDVEWVGPALHRAALTALLAAERRSVSLVDWVSFELMRERGLTRAFAFDEDFERIGFETVP